MRPVSTGLRFESAPGLTFDAALGAGLRTVLRDNILGGGGVVSVSGRMGLGMGKPVSRRKRSETSSNASVKNFEICDAITNEKYDVFEGLVRGG